MSFLLILSLLSCLWGCMRLTSVQRAFIKSLSDEKTQKKEKYNETSWTIFPLQQGLLCQSLYNMLKPSPACVPPHRWLKECPHIVSFEKRGHIAKIKKPRCISAWLSFLQISAQPLSYRGAYVGVTHKGWDVSQAIIKSELPWNQEDTGPNPDSDTHGQMRIWDKK